jgi:hypothetical protein
MSGFDGRDRERMLGRRTCENVEAYRQYPPADVPGAVAPLKAQSGRRVDQIEVENRCSTAEASPTGV